MFEEVQNEIRQVGATEAIEADKIILYSAVTEDDKIIKKREQNIDWIKKWDRNENMGNLEPISIKKELFMFIQRFFKTKTGVSIILFIGAPKEGKTAFLTKAKMYVMDREIFTDEIWIDCRKCYNILQLKL